MRFLAGLAMVLCCGIASADVTVHLPSNGTAERTLIIKPTGRVVTVETSIEILDDVRFVPGSTQLAQTANHTLDALASSLTDNPSITRLEVQAFGSDLHATHAAQLALGAARAQIVMAALVKRGVSAARLQAQGYARPQRGADPKPLFMIVTRSS